MNCIIPFTKNIKFNSTIGEICSISLEHEYTINSDNLLGNFIITGEYKTHEVSVNTESFSYTLPFDVSLTNNIDKETLVFDIEDFTYDIIKPDSLDVNIEFSIKADDLKEEEVPIFEEIPREIDEIKLDEALNEREETKIEETKIIEEQEIEEDRKEDIPIESSNTIISMAEKEEETFVTYHIHMVKEGENIESICKLYNVNPTLVGEYNNIANLNPNDKIIIPEDE